MACKCEPSYANADGACSRCGEMDKNYPGVPKAEEGYDWTKVDGKCGGCGALRRMALDLACPTCHRRHPIEEIQAARKKFKEMKTTIHKRHLGVNHHRLKSNPDELAMAKAWVKFIEGGQAMPDRRPDAVDSLLDSGQACPHVNLASDRDRQVAATIVQWLGSPVGRCFILDALGIER